MIMDLNFAGQDLLRRSFKGQNLAGADFSHTNLQGASFVKAILIGANFSHANLQSSQFTHAQLQRSNFSHAVAGLSQQWNLIWKICFMLGASLSGLGSGLCGSWTANLLLADNSLFKTGVAENAVIYSIIAGSLEVAVLTISLAALVYRGLGYALRLGAGTAIILGFIAILTTVQLEGVNPVNAAGETSVSVGGTAASGVFVGTASTLLLALSTTVLESIPLSVTMAAIGVGLAIKIGMITEVIPHLMRGTVLLPCVLFPIGLYLGQQALAQKAGYQSIHHLAKAILVIGGTQFRSANLTDANFSHASLKHVNFSHAIDFHTYWHHASLINWARVDQTLLMDAAVQHLLVNRKGRHQSYAGANLRGANLVDVDLSYADLKGSDLSDALLCKSNLEWANLAETQALGTNLTEAHMTGVCGLNSWNIDAATKLTAIDCRWLYLLEHPKPNTDDRERRPSSGEFAAGEFTSLFQELLDTVDLIFRDGINWGAFSQSLRQVQSENQTIPLEVQSIENKGNGIVVVRIKTPPDASKETLHSQFINFYQGAIALSTQQQKLLTSHAQEIRDMRSIIDRLIQRPLSEQVVILNIGQGDFQTGFPVTLQILQDGATLPVSQHTGQLPPNAQLPQSYDYWQSAYRRSLKAPRIEVPSQVTNVSRDEFFSDCIEASHRLHQQFNFWVAAESFCAIERAMQIKLDAAQPIRMILQTDSPQLRQLPWHLWRFFEDYTQAELALSKQTYQSPTLTALPCKISDLPQVRILAILGDSQGINLEQDKAALANLDAEVTLLVEPQQQDLSTTLWDRPWDILFFAGHSRSYSDGIQGYLQINKNQRLQIADIRFALTQAIARGLKLAIFNSCDGLGLAHQLADLQIPQMIVMRQPVPDAVAQAFLIGFLKSFANGRSLYQSVREARERLQDLEEQYPCATWLPIIIQNPSAVPPTWLDLKQA
jgi:uncharacterized protein YjbI with pentapeptide repeats